MNNFKKQFIFLAMLSLACIAFSGCGPDICACLQEADKENPDQEIMEKCRSVFAEMDMEEVEAEVKKCGR